MPDAIRHRHRVVVSKNCRWTHVIYLDGALAIDFDPALRLTTYSPRVPPTDENHFDPGAATLRRTCEVCLFL